MNRRLGEALWIAGGTGTTALGTLVGVRVPTQFLPPPAYGVLSLVLGMSTLAISLFSTPLTQAAIHYFPSVTATGSARAILQSLIRCFRRLAPWIALTVLGTGIAYVTWGHGSATIVILATLLLASDCWRSANLSLLNAARRHHRYISWTFIDTWARPLVGTAVVLTLGPSPQAVLLGYVAVSLVLLAVFSYRLWPPAAAANSVVDPASRAVEPRTLDARMWSYALPLIPLGVIAWASNLGDRYIIAGALGVGDAGVYAAVYGLASAPFMLTGGTVELALRPAHQAAVAAGNHERARAIFRTWLLAVVSACTIGVLIFAFAHQTLAALCVGQTYRHASGLMPWIGLGYAIRSASYVFERVCYAYGQTRRVLVIQLCAVAATAVATPSGVFLGGLKGAAIAVPIYFSVQLLTAIVLARRTLRDADGHGRQVYGSLTA
jgi:O-antigen/teichoic acid export membrane protein